MINAEIKKRVVAASHAAFPHVSVPEFTLVHPEKSEHGDFAANIALVMAKMLQMPPFEVAERIAEAMPQDMRIAKAEAVRPGFINLHLSESYFLNSLQETVDGVSEKNTSGKKILLEFGQPNTHKVPHIGHLFSYIYGESCARLLEATGNEVVRLNYQGDIGPHVARCLWAYMRKNQPEPETLEDKVAYLQVCYQEGSSAYADDPIAKGEVDAINTQIYQRNSDIMPLWEKTRQWCLAYYNVNIEARLGIIYDRSYLESEVFESGKQIVESNLAKGIFEEDQQAIIFRGEAYGLHTRVFVNSRGNPTYEAKDIGLVTAKVRDFSPFDLCVVTTASEQNEYWQVVKKAAELIYPELEGKLKHIGFGLINLSTGKMSSRTGKVLTAESLLETVKERVGEVLDETRQYDEVTTKKLSEQVALGAVRYSFLKTSPSKNIAFDLETSIAFEGSSGPYLQYTYARTQSVLRKAGELGSLPDGYVMNAEEKAVVTWLDRYEESVLEAASEFSPHVVAGYLFELAQRYSHFYNEHSILQAGDLEKQFRLVLTVAVAKRLASGLHLLGIETPEQI